MEYNSRDCRVNIPEDPSDIDDFLDDDEVPITAGARMITDTDIDQDSLEGSMMFKRDKEKALEERGIDDECDEDF